MAADDRHTIELFLYGLTQLRVDDEGCAPSDWEDVAAVALLCPNVRLALSGADDEHSVRVRELVAATGRITL